MGAGVGHPKGEGMSRYQAHYDALFAAVEAEHGKLDEETLTSIIGFDGGGPVSLSRIANRKLYVTCELSVYPEQVESIEGFNYELLLRDWLDEAAAQALLTELGDLSMRAQLGDGHTIDVSGIVPAGFPGIVRLQEYCRAFIGGRSYGVYEVSPAE